MNNECVLGDTKVLVPIEEIVITEEVIHLQIGTINIQASSGHVFDIMREDHKEFLRADELKVGDMFLADISLLSSGNKVLGSDRKFHAVKEIKKGGYSVGNKREIL